MMSSYELVIPMVLEMKSLFVNKSAAPFNIELPILLRADLLSSIILNYKLFFHFIKIIYHIYLSELANHS